MTTMDTRHHKELCVLACMFDPESFEVVTSTLTAGDFATSEHKHVFLAISKMYQDGEVSGSVDPVRLLDVCKHHGWAVRWQTIADAHELPWLSSTAAYHCSRVLDESRIDKLKRLGEYIAASTESTDEFIEQQIQALEAIRDNSLAVPVVTAGEALDRLKESRKNPLRKQSTGFGSVDNTLAGGLKAGQLVIVGGRPGSGKTAMMAQIAASGAMKNRPAMIVSLEITVEEFAERLATSISEDNIYSMPLFFSEQALMLDKICSLARVMVRRHKIGLLVVDYLQLVNAGLDGRNSREEQVSHCSRTFKRLALELKIPVVVGSQLNRESDKGSKEPKLSDLRESGAIEQDADLVFLLYREDLSKPDALVNLAKHRGGPVRKFEMNLIGREFRFEEKVVDADLSGYRF